MAEKRIQWGPGREQAFKDYIEAEINMALSARAALEQRWRTYLEQYRAPANQPLKSFPFEGAANFVLPVTATDVDQLYAKFMQTIHAPANLWTTEGLNPNWVDAAKPIQDFLQWMDGAIVKMEDVNARALLELVKLGTCIYKTDWLYERREVWSYDGSGKRIRAERTVSHPIVDHVRLVDFLLPAYSYAIQADDQGGAPWVAERHRIRLGKLEAIADASEPYMPNYGRLAVEKVRAWLTPDQLPHDEKIQQLEFNNTGSGGKDGLDFEHAHLNSTDRSPSGIGNTPKDEVEIWEIHARFATQGTIESDIVVEYHIPTQSIIRGTYLRYHHGMRPYTRAVYFPTEGFYGIGVSEQLEMFQTCESDLFNWQHDNVLLSNSVMLGVKQGGNIAPGEPIFPGRILVTDGSPKDEIMPIQLGSGVYTGLDKLRADARFMGQLRSGVGDLQNGSINSLPSRTPATTVQALLETGATRPDLTLKQLRKALSEVGLRIIQLIQQHAQPGVNADGEKVLAAAISVLGDEAGIEVVKKLGLPLEGAEYGLGVNLTATSATANKELQKQSWMGVIQLQGQMAPQFIQTMQLATQMWGTPVGQVALDMCQGMAYATRRLYEAFDIRPLNDVVPKIPKDPVQAITDPLAALPLLPEGSGAPGGAPGQPQLGAPAGPPGAGSPAGV